MPRWLSKISPDVRVGVIVTVSAIVVWLSGAVTALFLKARFFDGCF